MHKIERHLCLHFALLTTLSGLLMSTGAYANDLWLVALLAAVCSYIFVDRLRWFWLPMPLAYFLMAVAAMYCMGDFVNQGGGELSTSGLQLTAVARLLVLVQAALLFQRKNRRVFEQIGMFCLLEILVAAVLNDALIFGILLIPISILALSGLVLLQIWIPTQRREEVSKSIKVCSGGWSGNIEAIAASTPRMAAGVLGPAVMIFAACFFYTLPRTSSQAGTPFSPGRPTTGFSETLEIGQFGQLLQNDAIVLRVQLKDLETGANYRVLGPLYMRGRALEGYFFKRGDVSKWRSIASGMLRTGHALPSEFIPTFHDRVGYDRVRVNVTAEPIRSDAAFAIAPYFELDDRQKLSHSIGLWTLRIPGNYGEEGRNEYSYGTHAFSRGLQTRWIRNLGVEEAQRLRRRSRDDADSVADPWRELSSDRRKKMLEIEPDLFPELIGMANRVVDEQTSTDATPVEIAKTLESYLRDSGEFSYTTDLTARRDPALDPVEQFIRRDRRGHCQYFASALALMLRSQGIPTRVISGFKTNEYNQFGGFYTARQLHAHAWVEAYFAEDQIPDTEMLRGQIPVGGGWMRLDPTPGRELNEQSNVDSAFELAQALWDDYVVELNSRRQPLGLFHNIADGETSPYLAITRRVERLILDLRSGQLGGGRLSLEQIFSWRTALLVVVALIVITAAYNILSGMRWQLAGDAQQRRPEPRIWMTVDFYQRLKSMLASAGFDRPTGKTPRRWLQEVSRDLSTRPNNTMKIAGVQGRLGLLGNLFYQRRYGGLPHLSEQQQAEVSEALDEVERFLKPRS